MMLAAGCGSHTLPAPGTPVVTLADSSGSGDFASYIVNIDSIILTASDGSLANALPLGQGGVAAAGLSVDLARLTDLSELLDAPAVPSGTYLSAQITLDYSAASIWVNLNGHAVAAHATTSSGAAIGVVTVKVTFDPAAPLVITRGVSTRVAIDVDLAAANSISTVNGAPVVSVQPFLIMRPAPADSTALRARGLLVIAQSTGFIMNTRPLYDLTQSGLGAVDVATSAQTYFNVNGVTYAGAAGLAALGQLNENSPIAAYGTLGSLAGITPGFNATAVYAGSSLESPLQDHISGVVAARTGNTLTVRGALLVTRLIGAVPTFHDSVPVTVGSGTIVSEDGVPVSGLAAAAVSVGQQLDVSGQVSTDSSGNVSLDATAGQVRLTPTRVWGTLNSATAGSLSLNAGTFDDFATAGFDFTGTAAAGQTTNPAAYAVNTGALDESAIPANTLLAVDGLVTPFGSAPPNFDATAVTPGTSIPQQLIVEWPNGTTAPFSSASSAGLTVNLGNPDLGSVHYIRTGPQQIDLNSLATSPLITTVGADQSNLQLAIGNTTLTSGISVFSTATGFATAIGTTLNGTNKLFRLVAVGSYDAATQTFVASSISLALHE